MPPAPIIAIRMRPPRHQLPPLAARSWRSWNGIRQP